MRICRWFDITGSDLLAPDGTAYAGIEATGPYWSDAYSVSVAPEPASLMLAAVAATILVLRRRAAT